MIYFFQGGNSNEEYKKIFRKAFDGIFISYLTGLEVDANKEKLMWGTNVVPSFDYFDFYMLIENCNEKDIEKNLKDIPSILKLHKPDVDKIMLINAYKNIISGFINYKIDNNFYSKFHLFFKLFSKIDFSQEEIFEIIDNLIKLINYVNNNELENKFNFNNMKNKTIYYFLVDAYNKNYPQKDFLNNEQLEKLLYLTIEESINIDAHVAKAFNYDCMLRHICGILKSSNNSYKLKNQKKFLSLVNKINNDPYWKLFVITYIYPFIIEQDDLYGIAHNLLKNCSTKQYVDILFQSIFSKIVKIDKELTFIDTPGLLVEESIVDKVDSETLRRIVPKSELKPTIFQVKVPQTFIVDSILRIDLEEENDIVFYISNNLPILRQYKDTDKLKDLEKHKLKISDKEDIVIDGLGFIKVMKQTELTVYTLKGVRVYTRKSFL